MANLFKRGKKWYVQWKDENSKWRMEAAYTDKKLSQKKADELEFEAEQKRRGWGDVRGMAPRR